MGQKITDILFPRPPLSPDDAALRADIEEIRTAEPALFAEIEERTKARPGVNIMKRVFIFIPCIVIVALIALLPPALFSHYDPSRLTFWVTWVSLPIMLLGLPAMIGGLFYTIKRADSRKNLLAPNQKPIEELLRNLVAATLPRVLGTELTMVAGEENASKVRQLLSDSQLTTLPADKFSVFNTYAMNVNNPVSFNEIRTPEGYANGGFLFVVVELPKRLLGITFVRAESNSQKSDILGVLGVAKDVEETILEWNEFEDKLHVATTNEAEARYILTPDFMEDLHQWWGQAGKVNYQSSDFSGSTSAWIRMVFKGNLLMMLLPAYHPENERGRVYYFGRRPQDYLFTVAKPIIFTLKLIKDLRL